MGRRIPKFIGCNRTIWSASACILGVLWPVLFCGVPAGWAGSREMWEGVSESIDTLIEERDCLDEDKLSGGGDGTRCRARSHERMSRFQEEIRRRQEAKEARQRQEEESREYQRQLSERNRLREQPVVVPVQPMPKNDIPSFQADQGRFDTGRDRYQHNPANEASRCVSVREENALFTYYFHNTCSFPIELIYCANTQVRPNNCQERGYDNLTMLGPGRKDAMTTTARGKPISWEYGACKKGAMYYTSEMSNRREYKCVDR